MTSYHMLLLFTLGLLGTAVDAAESDIHAALARHPIDESAVTAACAAGGGAVVDEAMRYVLVDAWPQDQPACLFALLRATRTADPPPVAAWLLAHAGGDARSLGPMAMLISPAAPGAGRVDPGRVEALALVGTLLDAVAQRAVEAPQRQIAARILECFVGAGGAPPAGVAERMRGWLVAGEGMDAAAMVDLCRAHLLRPGDRVDRTVARLDAHDYQAPEALARLSLFTADAAILGAAEHRVLPLDLEKGGLHWYLANGRPTTPLIIESVGALLALPPQRRALATRHVLCRALRRCDPAQLAALRPQVVRIPALEVNYLLPVVRAIGDRCDDPALIAPFAGPIVRTFLDAPAQAVGGSILELALDGWRMPDDLVGPGWALLADSERSARIGVRDRVGLISLLVRRLDAASRADDHLRMVLMDQAGPQTGGYGMCLLRYLSVTAGFAPDAGYLAEWADTAEHRAALLGLVPGWTGGQMAFAETIAAEASRESPMAREGTLWSLRYCMPPTMVTAGAVRRWLDERVPADENGALLRALVLERFGDAPPIAPPTAPPSATWNNDNLVIAFELALQRGKPAAALAIVDALARDRDPSDACLWILAALAGRQRPPPSLQETDLRPQVGAAAADLVVAHADVIRPIARHLCTLSIEAPEESDGLGLSQLFRWLAAVDAISVPGP